MQITPDDEFYRNHTPQELRVTYEIAGPLEVAVVDAEGRTRGGCSVAPGKTQHHTFAVPPGGAIRCMSGSGVCTWKAMGIAGLVRAQWQRARDGVRAADIKVRELVPAAIQRRLPLALSLLLIVWVNAYICRQTFFIEYTGRMNSMHGFWIAIARLAGEHWHKPSWWPYWYNGMPFEFTYAPLVPGLTAAIARIFGTSAPHAFQIVSGIVYCLGPLALFLMARQVTGRTGWSFLATIVYSLSAPTELLLPDDKFGWRHLGDARRLYVDFVWDEAPHQFALALACLAVFFLARFFRGRRYRSFLCAVLFTSLALLASAFGATILLLITGCLVATCEGARWKRSLLWAAICGITGYLIMCPFLPPSLIAAIRSNTKVFPNLVWRTSSTWTCLGVLLGGVLLWLLSRKWRPAYLRLFFLLTYVSLILPALYQKFELYFVPEPGRYKVELELAMTLLVVFAVAALADRLPRRVRIALAILLLWPARSQLISLRHFSKDTIKSVDITQTIEYQVARWVEPNLPGWRVTAPGSVWPWLDTFSKVPQFSGGSYPTAPNGEQLLADFELPGDPEKTAIPTLWYKAYGVDAVIAAGVNSPEFWQPHLAGHQFDKAFPILWDQRDTRIYAVPRVARTLAHAIPQSALVARPPAHTSETAAVEKYVAAIDEADRNPARFEWLTDNRARIHAAVGADQVLSVQMTYHPGWKAAAAQGPVAISKDGLGDIVLSPERPGEYDITLIYDGGREGKLCRAVSAATMLAVALAAFRRWK